MITNQHTSAKTIDQLLVDFHTLTNMKICIFDASGKEIDYYPERLAPFCQQLRKDEKLDEMCKLCDQKAISECRNTRMAKIYTCHAGLTECVAPIIVAGAIRGFIAFGQIREDKNDTSVNELALKLYPKLSAEYNALPLISKRKIEAAAHVLEACASYEQFKQFVDTLESNLEARIEEYVHNKITENIGVERMCRHFHCSRKELYSIIKRAYNCTPAEFIKNTRLKYACDLLKSTNKSVSKIAILCGIEDYNYFSKIFKKNIGISPREYRKTYTENKK